MIVLNHLNSSRLKYLLFTLIVVFGSVPSLHANPESGSNQVFHSSTISGFVFDQERNPIHRVDVELLNENYNLRARVKTDSLGRYQFFGISDGRYYVKVLPFTFNLLDQTQEVIVQTISLLGEGIGNFEQDFYLERKQGGLGDTKTGVVFVQDVPKDAEDLYDEAMEDLSEKKAAEGMKKLVGAIKIFPNYYNASQRLGIELLKTEQYLEAVRLFIIASDSNPKSSRSLYYMGFALNKLGKSYNKAALIALGKAAEIASAAWEVEYLIGKIHREDGNFLDAEKHLLRSKKIADTKQPSIHIELAQLYGNDLKRYDKAADELELYLKSSKKKDDKIEKKISDLREKARKS